MAETAIQGLRASSSSRSPSPPPSIQDENNPSSSSSPPPPPPPTVHIAGSEDVGARGKKRPATEDSHEEGPHKPTKRRAARACVSCRARKVRCDVIEGAPCGNCRWDKVECIVQENRRRKKNLGAIPAVGQGNPTEAQLLRKAPSANLAAAAINHRNANARPASGGSLASSAIGVEASQNHKKGANAGDQRKPRKRNSSSSKGNKDLNLEGVNTGYGAENGQAPHTFYQPTGLQSVDAGINLNYPSSLSGLEDAQAAGARFFSIIGEATAVQLPPFVRPISSKIAPEDVGYLQTKGALSIPNITLQNELLRAYIEYVHPFMPIIDLIPFLSVINRYDGMEGQVSLFLYHAVLFSATAFVDMRHLREAGYASRKAARRAYFQRTRLLYDFDYESDRLILIQGLMLMTFWYETPDDQKDTWHWMGVAVSLAHTIGLHRNLEMTNLTPATQKLWKRIWWSCFMRDRLIALGMRRPTRIKDEDFDVPMLAETDFEIQALPEHITIISPECTLMRNVEMQRELAIMCVQKAKLCVCISELLKTQYSVLIRDNIERENTTSSTMMLFPNKKMDGLDSVHMVDASLRAWMEALPECCQHRMLLPSDVRDGRSTIAVQRTLLHMAYHTTVSALHRPQFLPSSPSQAPALPRQVQEMSRHRVKDAATRVTAMATELYHLRLERYLPTSGVTFILPAMIIHLLEMKSSVPDARARATRGFRQCMRVLGKLRDIYASADYATGFLDAALRKAAIDINTNIEPSTLAMMKEVPDEFSVQTPPPENMSHMATPEMFFPTTQTKPERQPSRLERSTGGALLPPPPLAINTAVLEVSTANSPPHTELGSSDVTPRGTNDSEGQPIEMDISDIDFSQQGANDFDWNAVSGTDLDLDQWLQFPSEGLNGTEEDMMWGIDVSAMPSGRIFDSQGALSPAI